MGFTKINVGASKDKENIWWALIKKCVSKNFDLTQLKKSGLVPMRKNKNKLDQLLICNINR
jgi:hypothetical protein